MKRSLNIKSPRVDESFWDKLDTDIDKIGNRAKQKLYKYQLSQYQTINTNPQTKDPIKPNKKQTRQLRSQKTSQSIPNIGRRELESLEKEEEAKKKMMRNRLVYLEHEREKKNKTIQLARRKFQHIVTVRARNFKERQDVQKKISSINREEKESKLNLVKEVKTGRERRNMSLNNWRETVQENAKKIRNENSQNRSFISLKNQQMAEENFEKAQKNKNSLERSRSIILEVREKRIDEMKKMQKMKFENRLQVLNHQKKNNQAILNKLKAETEKIAKWKSRAHKEIDDYFSFLGFTPQIPSKKNGHGNKSQNRSREYGEKSQRSFYVTNL